jgi:uncharacterized metal-binding protein
MPNGKTHDAITFFLIAPTFAATYLMTQNIFCAVIVTVGMLIGGLMFGPDLDIKSTQQSRWGILQSFWYPYQSIFKHRSRWSHGLVFGTLFRVIYFVGATSIVAFLILYFIAAYNNRDLPNILQITKSWQPIGEYIRSNFGEYSMVYLFLGLWIGAASHTATDMAGTFIKTGRISDFI